MRKLGLDIGGRRIGVALSDPLGLRAQSLEVIERENFSTEIAKLKEIIEKYQVDEVIVGVPLTLKGKIGPQARETEEYIHKLQLKLGVPLKKWDERLSSRVAKGILQEGKIKGKQKKQVAHKLAAAIILQGYLDSLK